MASSISNTKSVRSVRGLFAYRVGNPDGVYRCISKTSRIHHGEWIKLYPKQTTGGFKFCFVTINRCPNDYIYDWINITDIEPVRGYMKDRNSIQFHLKEVKNANK